MKVQVEEEEEFMRKIRARDDEVKRLKEQYVREREDQEASRPNDHSFFTPIAIKPPRLSSSPVPIRIQSSRSMPSEPQTGFSVSPLPPIRALSWKDQQVQTGGKVSRSKASRQEPPVNPPPTRPLVNILTPLPPLS